MSLEIVTATFTICTFVLVLSNGLAMTQLQNSYDKMRLEFYKMIPIHGIINNLIQKLVTRQEPIGLYSSMV